ncbi:hypothetical protein [Falsiroseomonas sp.]|uniref:hypothetical protein n=1 Tax=Falsiroseomonas sp. TaxID=2870721 RepID=UPI003564DA78
MGFASGAIGTMTRRCSAAGPQAWALREDFAAHPPASTGVQVSCLTHPDFLIEMAAIAVIEA